MQALTPNKSMANAVRTCKDCKGSGRDRWEDRPCRECGGTGTIPEPDYEALVRRVVTKRNGRVRLRSTPPAEYRERLRSLEDRRAYYVWRLARFHGGIDVTMPVVAETLSYFDPWTDELQELAAALARVLLGTDMAAAARWGALLGIPGAEALQERPGLPPTAYAHGPVVLGGKPIEEWIERL